MKRKKCGTCGFKDAVKRLKIKGLFFNKHVFLSTLIHANLFVLYVYHCVYLGSWLEDPELLHRGQRRIQWDNYHGTTAVRQMLCDVPARSCQSLDLLLARHED